MAITDYIDFVNNYLTKNGMIGNAANINKAPDQLKLEIDEVNSLKVDKSTFDATNLNRADKYLSNQNIVNMFYTNGDLTKIRYRVDTDTDYELFTYTSGELSKIAHYIGGVLKGNSVLSYTNGELKSVVFTAV